MRRIPELDGLRGVAILMVLVYHLSGLVSAGNHIWAYYVQDFLALAWSGVDLFFVLSGFLIGGILLDARDSPRYFKTFYIRRAFRILPIYAVFIGLLSLLVRQRIIDEPTIPWYAYLTFTQNFKYVLGAAFVPASMVITWSLAVEEQFYLVLPSVVRFTSLKHLYSILAIGIVAAPLLRIFLVRNYKFGGIAAFTLMPCRADALLLGVAAAMLTRHTKNWEWVKKKKRALVYVCATLILMLPGFVLLKQADEIHSPLMSTIGFTWLALLYTNLLLIIFLYQGGWLSRVLVVRPLREMGSISYTLYLIHMAVITAVFQVAEHKHPWVESWHDSRLLALAVCLSIGLSAVSWRFFEKPLVTIGHRTKY